MFSPCFVHFLGFEEHDTVQDTQFTSMKKLVTFPNPSLFFLTVALFTATCCLRERSPLLLGFAVGPASGDATSQQVAVVQRLPRWAAQAPAQRAAGCWPSYTVYSAGAGRHPCFHHLAHACVVKCLHVRKLHLRQTTKGNCVSPLPECHVEERNLGFARKVCKPVSQSVCCMTEEPKSP